MGFIDNISPLIVIYIIWRIFSKVQKSIPKDEDVGDKVSSSGDGSGPVALNIRDVLQQILRGGEVEVGRPPVQQSTGEQQPASYNSCPPVIAEEQTSVTVAGLEDKGRDLVGDMTPGEVVGSSLKKQRRPGLVKSRRQLQQAVIWSEILAKPLALRNDEREGF